MQIPFHPIVVHFPIALSFILPLLILVFAFMIKKNKMTHLAWVVIIGLQLLTTVSGYVALESGENEEHLVQKVVDKQFVHHHEEAAEIFVGSTVVALVLSVAVFFLRKEMQFVVQMIIAAVSLVSCYLAYNAGHSGGELVYIHGAGSAYVKTAPKEAVESILPTPGLNTSESPVANENESLKADDNDYGNSDEASEVEDEDSKQED